MTHATRLLFHWSGRCRHLLLSVILSLACTLPGAQAQEISSPTEPSTGEETGASITPSQIPPPTEASDAIPDQPRLKLAVLAHKGEEIAIDRWSGLVDYLNQQLPDQRFELEPLDWEAIQRAVSRGKVDFILGNPGMYVEFERIYHVRALATLVNLVRGERQTRFGSILFRRADRDDLQGASDLKGKRLAAVNNLAWGGWRVGWRQLLELGFDPLKELGDLQFLRSHNRVIRAVLNGEADAGVVRTDALESLADSGAVQLADFALLHQNTDYGGTFPLLLSTRLYPEWPFVATRKVSNELAGRVTQALLEMPSDHPGAVSGSFAGWTAAENYQSVQDTLRVLGVMPGLTTSPSNQPLGEHAAVIARTEVAQNGESPPSEGMNTATDEETADQTPSASESPAPQPPPLAIDPTLLKQVNIGVLAHKGAEYAMDRWGPLGDYLTSTIPGYAFNILPLDWDQMRAAVISARVDFMLGNPGMYVEYEFLYNVRSLATLKSLRLGKPSSKFGAILFRRADRNDIQSVQDLEGKRFAAVSESAWGGWQVGWRQMLELGFDPRKQLGQLVFTKSHNAVIKAVLDGTVDAGTVRTDALESYVDRGKAKLEDFSLIYRNEAYGDKFPFLLSTRLYPEWSFSATANVDEDLAEKVTISLLRMPAAHPAAVHGEYAGWTIPENYQPIHDTFKMLGIPPYEDFQAITPEMVLDKYGPVLVVTLIALLLLLLAIAVYSYFLGKNALEESESSEIEGQREAIWLDSSPPWRKVLVRSLPMVSVTAFSVLLLIYVSYGESRRVYEKFQLDRVASQSESLRGVIEEFLGQGLPFSFVTPLLEENLALGKFAGFNALVGDPQANDKGQATNGILLIDADENLVFSNLPEDEEGLSQGVQGLLSGNAIPDIRYPSYHQGDRYRMRVPLQDPSADEQTELGQLIVSTPDSEITGPVDRIFTPVIQIGLGIILGFTLLVLLLEARIGRGRDRLEKYLFVVVFGVMATLVLQQLFLIYEDGAEVRTKASAAALGDRLRAISDTGTDFTEVQGLGQLFTEFQKKDPEIGVLSLLINDNVLIHPNPKMVGFAWNPDPMDYEQRQSLDADDRAELVVVMPWEAVRDKILRSIKNFSSLFISCAFIVFIFLSAARSVRDLERRHSVSDDDRARIQRNANVWLNMIVVAWFLSIFAEGMNASFLPQFLTQAASANQISETWATVLFSAFFAAFVAVLVPAGKYAQTHEVKNLLVAGVGCIALGLVMMSLTTDFYLLLVARIIGGAGQGLAFIGVQAFIFAVTTAGNKSQGASRMILGRNAGVISGAAIGALLVVYSSTTDIFLLGAGLAGLTGMFIILFIPRIGSKPENTSSASAPPAETTSEPAKPRPAGLGALLSDFEFLRSALFIGTSNKMIYNGVVFYSVPILMTRMNYAQEDIGQALMVFAISIMITNSFIPKLADRSGNSAFILFLGALTMGIGTMLLGISDWASRFSNVLPYINEIALFGGLMILGFGNGFLAAPVVGHIAKTRSVQRLGQSYTMSVFRVLERSGDIIGPLLIGHLLVITANNTLVLSAVGGAMILLGLIFYLLSEQRQQRKTRDAHAHHGMETAQAN